MFHLSKRVFEETGWPGTFSRASFGASAGWGLNWESPAGPYASEKSPPTFTMVDTGDVKVYFKRPSVIYWNPQHKRAYIWFADQNIGLSGHFSDNIGELAYPVVEIQQGIEPHPKQWARLPSVDTYTDQLAARQLALRIDYRNKDGTWQTCYLQRQEVHHKQDDTRCYSSYDTALALRYFVERRPMTDKSPDVVADFGIAKFVSELTFGHLEQVYRFTELEVGEDVSAGYKVPLFQPAQQMRDLGLKNVDAPWPGTILLKSITTPRADGMPAKTRSACDSCVILRTVVALVKCERLPGTNQCKRCHKLGRPCSWTRTVLINNDTQSKSTPRGPMADDLEKAFWAGGYVDGAMPMDDPVKVVVTI
jgi:hypothetical protein